MTNAFLLHTYENVLHECAHVTHLSFEDTYTVILLTNC